MSQIFILVILSIINLAIECSQKQIAFCYRSEECYELNDKTFKDKWENQLKYKFNQVQTIKIHALTLSESNYLTLFSHSLPQLKSLFFKNHDQFNIKNQIQQKNTLTPNIVKLIFTSSYFPQLKHLDMSGTNLDFRHFQFLDQIDKPIHSNLVSFILLQNYLEERAFKFLTKINFNGTLKELILAQNSLISSKSIDSILKIIRQEGKEKSSLTNISVYKTLITTDSMMRLLQGINLQKLQNLNIGHNAFQHSKSYDIPFNNSFFEFLSNCNLTSLKRLSMASLDLDGQQLQYLKNLRLPSLEILDLSQNFISDDFFRFWITKQKMPKLKYLRLHQADLTDIGIELLSKSGIQVSALQLMNNRKLTSMYLDHLSVMNSSKFVRLDLSVNMVYERSLRIFFEGKDFENLKYLKLNVMSDAFRLFSFINWSSMKNLQVLSMQQTDCTQSFENFFSDKITFPKLKILRLGGLWFTKDFSIRFLDNLKNFGPQLKYTYIMNHKLVPDVNYFNLTEIDSVNIPDGMYLQNQNMKVRKMQNDSRWEFIFLNLNKEFFKINFHFSYFDNYYKEGDAFWELIYMNETQIGMVVQKLKEVSTFNCIEKINFVSWNEFVVFRQMMFLDSKINNIQYINAIKDVTTDLSFQLYLPYLFAINYIQTNLSTINQTPQYIYYLNKMQMPLLETLIFQSQNWGMFPFFANSLLLKNKNIENLIIIQCKLSCLLFDKMFQNVELLYLRTLRIPSNQIEIQCLKRFFKMHSKVKILDVSDNFLEKAFFDEVIAQNQIILEILAVSFIQIGDAQFSKIFQINTQFLVSLQAAMISISSEGIRKLIGKKTESVFPKITAIDLASNYIDDNGLEALLKTGVPFLRQLKIFNVQNPNLINNLLSYPNKLTLINALDANIYGLKQNLDPRSTRHIAQMTLKSPNFILQDFKILSNLQFPNLAMAILLIQNIYQCQILKYLLQIVKTTQVFQIAIKNQKQKGRFINDKCLQVHDSSKTHANHLKGFVIYWRQELAHIPNFYTYLYSQNQIVTALSLDKCLISDQLLLQIVRKCNIEHIYDVRLGNNRLSDASVLRFFQQPLKKLNWLKLNRNEFTFQALASFVDKIFYQLQTIDLSGNFIGDQAFFPKLKYLGLENVEMTRKGLLKLLQLKAPKLSSIQICNNDINELDLIDFISKLPLQNFTHLSVISTNIKISSINFQKLTYLIQKRFNRTIIVYAEIYHLELMNKSQL